MDTKSKKFRYNILFKIIAWAVCVAGACGVAFAARGLSMAGIPGGSADYASSEAAYEELRSYADQVHYAYYEPTEEQIRIETDAYVNDLNTQRKNEIAQALGVDPDSLSNIIYNQDTQEITYYGPDGSVVAVENAPGTSESGDTAPTEDTAAAVESEMSPGTIVDGGWSAPGDMAGGTGPVQPEVVTEYRMQRLMEIDAKYDELVKNAEQHIRDTYEENRAMSAKELEREKDMRYAAVQNGKLLDTNVDGDKPVTALQNAKLKQFVFYNENGEVGMRGAVMTESDKNYIDSHYPDTPVIYTAMTDEAYQRNAASYAQRYEAYQTNLMWLLICIGAFVAGFVWLMVTAGRQTDSDEIKIWAMDKLVYFDIGFVIMVVVVFLCMLGAYASAGAVYTFLNGDMSAASVAGVCAFIGGGVSALLLWAMSLSRRAKNDTAKEFTLCYAIFGGVKKLQEQAGAKSNAVGAFVWYVIAGIVIAVLGIVGLMGLNPVLAIVALVLAIIYVSLSLKYVLKKAAAIQEIEDGVERIKGGDMAYAIPESGSPNLDRIATGVNNIAEGLSSAVSKEVKAERMKTELITNISHDLKTPLTSILTYVDLLKKEKLSEDGKKYVDILDAKSNRLKVLTDDLFEAAKAQSGDVSVSLSKIELVQFMEQALGEMSDRMETSGLVFINDIPDDKMYVCADGRLLFRVIGNVMDNVIKYALEGSRVYISVAHEEDKVCVTVKNISKEELNISEDELMERFVRGDSSRNTEGSGLGLAIARSFTRLMGGEFSVEIDGDLFKVRILLAEDCA